ncbi:hypothetical protein H112_05281 [Trichophyton rubrum D6]|uniref:Uncharacterized protein n=2 Tax=Trichophyton TaxID=5550 RepID=A0A022VZD0_TRIRU|nr:hypothetical protein H100_05303 [Trichophyton rubrum MR850]EZF51431.1 hypothetical protein H103_05294 [Trichophyton rubrum CBS 288.86]EZF62014.1 hypothetical protein H104_05284 [Trichophyton rubrum CBS 289.86]EZF72705.1 hypothetical protein H105_05312 [Trichophyton soudanense CBS 452.61]EZF83485.1 hypothetical protein H110_05291 [Trichophyton rubrum MR1448]EZG05415.1 hypothetical protein H106_05132 [Trichophyton rubrum CBS 735.88]EZG15714.1 hypothetical protein H107_05423 [Trichophyton rub
MLELTYSPPDLDSRHPNSPGHTPYILGGGEEHCIHGRYVSSGRTNSALWEIGTAKPTPFGIWNLCSRCSQYKGSVLQNSNVKTFIYGTPEWVRMSSILYAGCTLGLPIDKCEIMLDEYEYLGVGA